MTDHVIDSLDRRNQLSRARAALVVMASLVLAAACGGGDGADASAAPAPDQMPAPSPSPSPSPAPAPAVAPAIGLQPVDTTVPVGQAAVFTVVATGSAPLAYAWKRGGVLIPGATDASFSTTPVDSSEDGALFSVLVSNAAGSVESRGARLSVAAAGSAWGSSRQDAAPLPRPINSPLNGASSNVRAARADVFGNFLLAGTTTGWYEPSGGNVGFGSHVVKYDANGVLKWGRLIHPQNTGNATAIASDSSGNVFVLGEINGAFPGQTTGSGGTDVYLAKLTPDGALTWLRQLANTGPDIGRGLAIDGANNVYVVGASGGTMTIGTATTEPGAFIAKFKGDDASLIWLRSSNVPANIGVVTQAFAVAVDAQGNAYAGGNTGNAGFVSKFAVDGTRNWTTKFDAPDTPGGSILKVNSVAASADGSAVFVGGSSTFDFNVSGPVPTMPGSRGSGGFVARTDGSGATQWIHMVPQETGSVAGAYAGAVNAMTTDVAGSAAYAAATGAIARFDGSGSLVWAQGIRSAAFGISLGANGDVLAAGTVTNINDYGTPGVAGSAFESWFADQRKASNGALH
jgi:Beta-propeller repeat